MQSILGKPIAEKILQHVAESIQSSGVTPGLAVVLIGDNPASRIYVGLKEKTAQAVGVYFEKHLFPAHTEERVVKELLHSLNERTDIHGILLQLPLPIGWDTDALISSLHPKKDVDGFHPDMLKRYLAGESLTQPVLPRAIEAVLCSTGESYQGKRAIALVNSAIFGRGIEKTLESLGLSVTLKEGSAEAATGQGLRGAAVIISVCGDPGYLRGEMVDEGVTIIDCGITQVGGKVLGDADMESMSKKTGWITPVPGGVGPLTIAFLLARTTELALGEEIGESIL